MGYEPTITRIEQTHVYASWFAHLKDPTARARILVRLRRLSLGLEGDVRAVGQGIRELRIDHGPGYRVYFVRRGAAWLLLLCGGDKSTQADDIRRAQALARHAQE